MDANPTAAITRVAHPLDQTVEGALMAVSARLRAGGVETPLLEARLLLEYTTGSTRAQLLAHPTTPLNGAAINTLASLAQRRVAGEPLAYIIQSREFFGLEFYVNNHVLVPRPETEILVERSIETLRGADQATGIVDVGTGSGAIALAVAHALPEARITALDASMDALRVARVNRDRLGLGSRVSLVGGNLLSPLRGPLTLIMANLPYIPSEHMESLPADVRDHEPRSALDGGAGGLQLYTELLYQASGLLAPRGHLILECEPFQVSSILELARSWLPDARPAVIRDGFGHDRIVQLTREDSS